MLEAISGAVSSYSRPSGPPQLSESQRSSVQSTLSKYDAGNLSAEDARAINEAFKAEGIRPSRDLKETIKAAGFDAQALKSQGGPKGAGGPPPPPPPSDEEDVVSALLEILEAYEDQTLDQDMIAEVQAKLQEAGYPPRDSYLELSV